MMKATIIFALLYCLASALYIQGHNISERKDEIRPRMANGTMAKQGEFPYQAYLVYYTGNQKKDANGVLFSHKYVLTTAQGAFGTDGVFVFLGSVIRLKAPVQLQVPKAKIIIHPKFDAHTLVNDIAIIELPPYQPTADIRPVALPKPGQTIFINSFGVVSGWGDTAPGKVPDNLYHTQLQIISNADCKKYYGRDQITNGQLCTNHFVGGHLCTGDAGAPLVSTSLKVLVGLASFAPAGGCNFNAPHGFTRVTFYLDWIKGQVGVVN